MKMIIIDAIKQANKKSSSEILQIPDGIPEEQINSMYKDAGKDLFDYLKKTYADPASTAYYYMEKHYSTVGQELFKNKALHSVRMNAGWRYQYIVKGSALCAKRFLTVSDLGGSGKDFTATIATTDPCDVLSIYVSVKNRDSTISGSSWPKAIQELEEKARNDKNKIGPYICVFGLNMQRGGNRVIKISNETKIPYSVNTEIWPSDFFWPFFTNYSYEEIVETVLDVLPGLDEQDSMGVEIPEALMESFGERCRNEGLLDEGGYFNDPQKLLKLYVFGTTKEK